MAEAFDIGFREGLEACVVIALMAALVPKPWSPAERRYFAGWILGAVVASIAVAAVIYDAAASVTADVVTGIEFTATAVAVVMLTATALWTGRFVHDQGAGVPMRIAAIVAALSVVREAVESACFLLDGRGDDATGRVGALVGGAALAATVSALVFGAALARVGWRVRCMVAQVLLVLVAAGMAMSLVRSAGDLGWLAADRAAWLEIPQLADPSFAAVRAGVAAFGLRAELSAIECLVWLAYVTSVGAVLARYWGVRGRFATDSAHGPDVRS